MLGAQSFESSSRRDNTPDSMVMETLSEELGRHFDINDVNTILESKGNAMSALSKTMQEYRTKMDEFEGEEGKDVVRAEFAKAIKNQAETLRIS